jgi:hypothetical protein
VADKITVDEVGDLLMEVASPFYKGFNEGEPEFRRTLTGEEAQNLLSSLHQIITVIKTGE